MSSKKTIGLLPCMGNETISKAMSQWQRSINGHIRGIITTTQCDSTPLSSKLSCYFAPNLYKDFCIGKVSSMRCCARHVFECRYEKDG